MSLATRIATLAGALLLAASPAKAQETAPRTDQQECALKGSINYFYNSESNAMGSYESSSLPARIGCREKMREYGLTLGPEWHDGTTSFSVGPYLRLVDKKLAFSLDYRIHGQDPKAKGLEGKERVGHDFFVRVDNGKDLRFIASAYGKATRDGFDLTVETGAGLRGFLGFNWVNPYALVSFRHDGFVRDNYGSIVLGATGRYGPCEADVSVRTVQQWGVSVKGRCVVTPNVNVVGSFRTTEANGTANSEKRESAALAGVEISH